MRPGYRSASSSRICGVQSVEPSSTATTSDSSPSGKGASSARRIDAARNSSSLYAGTRIESRRVVANYGLSRSAPGEMVAGRFTVRLVGQQRTQHLGILGWVVFQVAVLDDAELAQRVFQCRADGGPLAGVHLVMEHADTSGILLGQLIQN